MSIGVVKKGLWIIFHSPFYCVKLGHTTDLQLDTTEI